MYILYFYFMNALQKHPEISSIRIYMYILFDLKYVFQIRDALSFKLKYLISFTK